MYNKLVLSGGSKRGVLALGCLEYINEHYPDHLSSIKSYVGCSVGTIINYHLILGYSPIEIITNIINKKVIDYFKNMDLVKLGKCEGAFKWDKLQEYFEYVTISKYKRTFTMKELYDTFGKEFICITYNYTTQEEEVLSHITHPDLNCIDAIHMSSCVPILFKKFEYNNNMYIDGAISNNFPIDLVGEEENALAINITKMHINNKKEYNLLTHVHNMSSIVMIINVKNKLKNMKCKNCTIITIEGKDISTNGLHGNITDILNLFSYGYKDGETNYKSIIQN